MPDDEIIALRITVIGGKRHPDDQTLIWRGLPIGGIMLARGLPPSSRNGDGPATSKVPLDLERKKVS